jgi:hypothetical protein
MDAALELEAKAFMRTVKTAATASTVVVMQTPYVRYPRP